MADLILYRDGAYNIYTTIADGPCYSRALTLDELTEVIVTRYGDMGLTALPDRLKRAHNTGCSSLSGLTLVECIACNRAGPNESCLSADDFIARYLKND